MKQLKLSMTTKIMLAVILGVLFGVLSNGDLKSLKLIGDIFLRLIQMAIILLVMGQIIEAVGSLNSKELSRRGLKTIGIFLWTSFLAALFGIIIGYWLKPGVGNYLDTLTNGVEIETNAIGTASDVILNFFSPNVIQSMAEGSIAQIIIFSVLFGMAMSMVRHESGAQKVLDLIKEFNKIILKLVLMVMTMAPIGIFALIASTIGKLGMGVIMPLLKYLGAYGLATVIFLIVFTLYVSITCQIKLAKLVRGMFEMSVVALATTSSAITLPTAMKDAKEKLGISERVSKFVLPLGMTLNSNGAAMHMAITVITIAQIYGVEYSLVQYILIAVLSMLVSLSNAVVPGAGLVSMAIIIPQMGLPLESIAIFAGVEWFVGMLRTILNVDSDVYTALLVAKSEGDIDYSVYDE
ncbi:sodium:dicarboxylate symporter [Halolactibacillus alkaliphilus]|uniref:Sodium:dicarboxylate symporter n=1 Tax=Halolactibacillus alkaliphilus TaxID=442899 RepID=A0A511WWV1_9BACI|nr:dicarboxylate/amino acid:cation symporter [Halolactibacillus alkaliphilus]GEN55605.1 sodium:dicarboxylate symporter [Halolactibacillus alkaliphilus]GGN63791.1 sodium:dicarboxylate symporter [Halolactibacillus alkaliphilus]SFO62439.1 Na+/H+-dicarboxylate symporter [Halolactibacillus alkaliphilus]